MRVGVIVPVGGPTRWLEASLASILAQDPSPDRVVVVDDGGDPSLTLPPPLAARCEVVRRGQRGGPAAARNAGLALLDTELVAFADADDEWLPGKLAVQRGSFEAGAETALCFGRVEVIGPDGTRTGERWFEPPAGEIAPERLAALLYEHNPVVLSTVVARRAALEEAGGFAPGLDPVEDLDLWLRLAAAGGRFVFAPDARVRYRRHGGALTADVGALAEAALRVHRIHAGLVDPAVRDRVLARDLRALAQGRIRRRRHREARTLLREATALQAPTAGQRLRAGVLAVPGLRRALGHRDPYRR